MTVIETKICFKPLEIQCENIKRALSSLKTLKLMAINFQWHLRTLYNISQINNIVKRKIYNNPKTHIMASRLTSKGFKKKKSCQLTVWEGDSSHEETKYILVV